MLPAEQRCQTYLGLINGARGMFYFNCPVFTGLMWETLSRLAHEMQDLAPALMRDSAAGAIQYSPGEFDIGKGMVPDVLMNFFRFPDGRCLLLAVNIANYPVTATFAGRALDGPDKIDRLFVEGQLAVADGRVTEKLEPLATRAYVWRDAASSPEGRAQSHALSTVEGPSAPPGIAEGGANSPNEPSEISGGRANSPSEPSGIPAAVSGAPPGMSPPSEHVRSDWQVEMTPHPEEALTEAPLVSRFTGRKNMIANPSFEDSTFPGWPDYYIPVRYGRAEMERRYLLDTTERVHGKQSLKIMAPRGDYAGLAISQGEYVDPYNGDPDIDYLFSAWIKADRPGVKFQIKSGNLNETVKLSADWKRYSWRIRMPTRIWFSVTPLGGLSASVWLDALQLEKSEEPTEFEP